MTKIQPRAAVRYAIPAAIVLLVSVLLVALKFLRIDQMHGDSALFFQVTEHIAAHGSPMSSVYAQIWAYVHSHLIKMPAEAVALASLLPPQHPDENVLRLHAYFILFPLALAAKIVPVRIVLLSAYVLSFTGALFLAYALLIRRGVGAAAAALFALIVVTHPAWSEGLLSGQFYPDRLFVFSGFALLLVAISHKRRRGLLITLAVLCASVNERGGMVAGIALMLYALLYRRTDNDATFKFWLGTASLAFGEAMLKFIVVNDMYGKFISTDRLFSEWHRPQFVEQAVVFALVNVALFAFAGFEWRAALIALVTMLPNIFGSMGGSEKTGWVTHYHSFYLPVLMWASALGFIRAYGWARERGGFKIFYAAALCVLAYLCVIDPDALPVAFVPAHTAQTFVPALFSEARAYLGPQGMYLYRKGAQLAAAVPAGATVSTPELAMPALYRERTLYFLPMGLDRADYAVLTFQTDDDGRMTYSGVLNMHGAAEEQRVNAMIMQRMRRDGYDLDHPVAEIHGLQLAVIRRVRTRRYAPSSESAAGRRAFPTRPRLNARLRSRGTPPAT